MPGITAGCKESSCLPGIGFSKSTAKSKMSRSQILQSLFRQAVQGAKFRKRLVFLDLFCGDGGVSKAIRRQGFAVVSIDINNHPKLDLCAPDVQKLIFGWIRSRCIVGVWLATPCTAWRTLFLFRLHQFSAMRLQGNWGEMSVPGSLKSAA